MKSRAISIYLFLFSVNVTAQPLYCRLFCAAAVHFSLSNFLNVSRFMGTPLRLFNESKFRNDYWMKEMQNSISSTATKILERENVVCIFMYHSFWELARVLTYLCHKYFCIYTILLLLLYGLVFVFI